MTEHIKKHFHEDYVGTILEVGAAFPEMGNPIFSFRKQWNVISIEPNPAFCNEFRNLGYPILQYAAYKSDIGEQEFIISPNGLSNSSLNIFTPFSIGMGNLKDGYNEHSAINNNLSADFDYNFFPKEGETKTIRVETLSLNTILQRHHPDLSKIDVIIVDVEGFEMEVMQGIDIQKYSPKIIILENIRSYPEYREYMQTNGYDLYERINIDDIYKQKSS